MDVFEIVPNVSEGRRPGVVKRWAERAEGDAQLLDASCDPDHNRAVLSYRGSAASLQAVVAALAEQVFADVDLRTHSGVHPRTGALDVVPFVPLAGTSMADTVRLAQDAARELARRFDVPVFLYDFASSSRRTLPSLRRGGLERLSERLSEGGITPDFGPSEIDPRRGVVLVGARKPLVAFNVVLASDSEDAAREIAARVRGSSGGHPGIRAIGLYLDSRRRAQVSMNLIDLDAIGPLEAMQLVELEAQRRGVEIQECELIGLLPESVAIDVVQRTLRLPALAARQLLRDA